MEEPEDKLYSISSGRPASSKVETDLLNARKYGTIDFQNFKNSFTEAKVFISQLVDNTCSPSLICQFEGIVLINLTKGELGKPGELIWGSY